MDCSAALPVRSFGGTYQARRGEHTCFPLRKLSTFETLPVEPIASMYGLFTSSVNAFSSSPLQSLPDFVHVQILKSVGLSASSVHVPPSPTPAVDGL